MKTKEQIIKWLDKQPFCSKFYRNVVLQVTKLNFDASFIASAFIWMDTLEGSIFWGDVNKDYMSWYASSPLDEYKFDYTLVKGFPSTVNRSADKLIILNKLFIVRDNISGNNPMHVIRNCNGTLRVLTSTCSSALSFTSQEDAQHFLDTFRQELEEVKEYL